MKRAGGVVEVGWNASLPGSHPRLPSADAIVALSKRVYA